MLFSAWGDTSLTEGGALDTIAGETKQDWAARVKNDLSGGSVQKDKDIHIKTSS